jgi:hypothetical protein
MVALALLGLAWSWIGDARAQSARNKPKTETYTRPKPREPIKPQIPDVNRFQDDKVFLEHADSLFRPANEYEEFQIVKGTVKFRQGGMWMFCDSAYYYPEKNSMDAFGHVEMRQGDTLFVYADKLYYDGLEKHATLVRGPSRDKVELKNRTVNLKTDSLDYDVMNERGWYTTGGVLQDDVNTLTSIYGEYSPNTKQAKFRDDVKLVNNKDGYKLRTSELDYNTDTHIADINTHTVIEGANDTIVTTKGWYDTRTDHAQLTSRSTITHRDSANNVTWLEGDSIIYDKLTRLSRAYMFRDKSKHQQPMVLTDTARKVQLIGGYGEYNDSTRTAMATEYPLLIEYSRPDSLFLRADTILSYIVQEMVWPDSLDNMLSAATRARLARFESLQQIADSMPVVLSLLPYKFQLPGWGETPKLPEESEEQAPVSERSERSERSEPSEPSEPSESSEPSDSVDYSNNSNSTDTLDSLAAVDTVPPAPPGPKLDKLGRDSAFMIPKDFHVAKAIGKARFFNKDAQGVADTMIYVQHDSMMYMLRKPLVWSGERQVMGNRIDLHLNDSTVDWAYLPESGILGEHVDEDFYQQLSGTKMKAFIDNEMIKRLEVEGNVQTIVLPQESDSTVNKLVNAESSYLTIDFVDGKLDHLKMWPEVSGTVTPIGQVKQSQKFLQGFRWLDMLRPQRGWYGDRVRWIDELGEVPEELEQWFREASPIKAAPPKPSEYKGMVRTAKKQGK